MTIAPPPSPDIEEPKDLGFGSVIGGANEKRLLNRDGTFNPRRRGVPLLTSLAPYHFLLTISWPKFLALITVGYFVANTLFAFAYLACGAGALDGIPAARPAVRSAGILLQRRDAVDDRLRQHRPERVAPHVVMTIEALIGLLVFALGTGLLFARFSRPTAAIVFSSRSVVAPYRGITAFMFRVTNGRSNQIVEIEAKVLFSRIEGRCESTTS